MSSSDVHVFFFPFPLKGHTIPMVDLAILLASHGVKSTIVTTSTAAPQIKPTIEFSSSNPLIQLLTLPFSTENASLIDVPLTHESFAVLNTLELPLKRLIEENQPDCIVSDMLFPWTAHLAAQFNIPRLGFHGTSCFASYLIGIILSLGPENYGSAEDDYVYFVVPGLPHRIKILKSNLSGIATMPLDILPIIHESLSQTYGMVMNSFHELESEYNGSISSQKVWHVGPLSLYCPDASVRGGKIEGNLVDNCLNWLNGKKPDSVIYICFGSLARFGRSQMRELAIGLEESDHPFIWVVKDSTVILPEGFEERITKDDKGVIIKGWAPQAMILSHPSVGGFMTHCGWNSCLEGLSAGVPMVTWPLFADQLLNDKLLVDVLGIGVSVGVKICSCNSKERSVVKGEEVKKAVNEVMGSREKASERRKKANEIAKMAKKAVEEGGSSYNDVISLIQELKDIKMAGKVLPIQEN